MACKYYPQIALYENGIAINTENIKENGLGASEQSETYTNETISTASSIKVVHSYYYTNDPSNIYIEPIYYTLFNNSGDSWVASRCIEVGVYYNKRGCDFKVVQTGKNWLGSVSLWRNDYSTVKGASGGQYSGIRPVIDLNQGIKASYSQKYNNTFNTFTLNN